MREYSTPLLTITVLIDEKSKRRDVETCYGLSLLLLLELGEKKHTLLFDVGPSWELLEYNMACLGYSINDIDKIFITHWHRDHYGALLDLLENVNGRRKIKLYIPVRNRVSYEIEKRYSDKAVIIVCNRWTPIAPLMKSTGPIGSSFEHALKINLPGRGVVLVVGCSHAGLINIIKWSIESNEQLYTVIGGFHFKEKPLEDVERTLLFLEGIGVKYVVPLHDSNSYNLILDIMGDKFLDLGVGDSIVL